MKYAHLYCYGPIDDETGMFSSQKVLAFLASLGADVTHIRLHINSNGGNLYTAYNIHDQLIGSGKTIETVGEGMVASAATVLFLSGSKRTLTPNARVLIHKPRIPGEAFSGEDMFSDDLINTGQNLKNNENEMVDFYVNKTGLSKETVDALMKKDSFITADEAVEMKLATDISAALPVLAFYKEKNKSEEMKFLDKIKSETSTFLKAMADKLVAAEVPAAPVVASSAMTADGKTIYSATPLDEGVSAFSDEGMTVPMEDGTYTMQDESTLTIASGIVSAVAAKAVPPPAASLEDQVAALTAERDQLRTERDAVATEKATVEAEAIKTVSALSTRLSKIKSTGDPKISGEIQFKGEKPKEMSAEDRKAYMEAQAKPKK